MLKSSPPECPARDRSSPKAVVRCPFVKLPRSEGRYLVCHTRDGALSRTSEPYDSERERRCSSASARSRPSIPGVDRSQREKSTDEPEKAAAHDSKDGREYCSNDQEDWCRPDCLCSRRRSNAIDDDRPRGDQSQHDRYAGEQYPDTRPRPEDDLEQSAETQVPDSDFVFHRSPPSNSLHRNGRSLRSIRAANIAIARLSVNLRNGPIPGVGRALTDRLQFAGNCHRHRRPRKSCSCSVHLVWCRSVGRCIGTHRRESVRLMRRAPWGLA